MGTEVEKNVRKADSITPSSTINNISLPQIELKIIKMWGTALECICMSHKKSKSKRRRRGKRQKKKKKMWKIRIFNSTSFQVQFSTWPPKQLCQHT